MGNGIHAGIHLLTGLFLILWLEAYDIIAIVILISLFHFIIDFLKSYAILCHPHLKFNIFLFLVDQASHLMFIFLSVFIYSKPANLTSAEGLCKDAQSFITGSFNMAVHHHKLIASFILIIAGLWGVGIFIRIFLGNLHLRSCKNTPDSIINLGAVNANEGAERGGFLIGFLERLFIIISIILDMPLVIGFILATKSISRLKKFDDDRFVEVFVIGSFISFIAAIVIGYIIKSMEIIPLLNGN